MQTTTEHSLDVRHDESRRRFIAHVQGHEAELTYHLDGDRMVIDHTGVPEAIAGRGVAAGLVRNALEHARVEGLRVVPACSYAAAYLARHPEYAALRAEEA